MKWTTDVKLENQAGYVNYSHSMLSIGSCFSDEIGSRLKEGGFDISVNPFGVIFNPVSILQLVQNALTGSIREDLIIERDMKHFHYGYHSNVYGTSLEDLQKNIDGIQYNVQRKLLQGDRLFLTFGSAWAYRLIDQKAIVANCHKMPAQFFEKELIDLEKLKVFSTELFTKLFSENPKLKVMVSVSPVRHQKDGLHENNISKGVLHLFSKFLVEKFENVVYFPAYELVTDELRDYRFFKRDLVHPNEQAIDYVFERFSETNFDEATTHKFNLHERLKKAELHHFLNASIEEVRKHEDYIENLKEQLVALDK